MTDALTYDLTIQIDGAALTPSVAALLVLAQIEDSRALPDSFELRFRDPDRIALSKGRLRIGSKVRLGVRTGDSSSVAWLLDGEVTALEVELDARGSWTIVRGYDATHRLQRGSKVAAFRKMTGADIARKIAGDAGIPVGKLDATAVLDEVIQPNLSDWHFLTALAADLGLELTISEGRLSLSKPAKASDGTPVPLALGENLLRLRAAVTAAERLKEVSVRAWDPRTKKALVATKPAGSSDGAHIGLTPQQVGGDFRPGTLTVTEAGRATAQGHVDAMAASLAGQVADAYAEVEAVVRGNPLLRSGGVIDLKGVGAPFEGSYVVTSARHVFDGEEGYQTWLTVSGRQDRTLLGLVSRGRGGAAGSVPGLVPAIVTDTKDPDKQGRVKVTLPWLDDTLQTDWARTLQLGGAKGGGLVLPEVDDEVLVGFEQGRLERPFVLGGLYNGVDKPVRGSDDAVDGNSGAISCRAVASRSGNTVEILDSSQGVNGVRIATGDGKYVVLLDKKGTTIKVTSAGKVEIAADGDVTLKAAGNATVEATKGLTLKAGQDLMLEGMNVTVKANAKVSVEGQSGAELKSTGQTVVTGTQAQLKGNAMAEISAALVKIN